MKLHTFDVLYHVGTLDAAHKGTRGESLEGLGLSVSQCPQAWVRIAKLGGLPWWQLSKQGNRFLDFHALSAQEQQTYLLWGQSQQLLQPAQLWQASWYDDELQAQCCSLHLSEEQALGEIEEPDSVQAVSGWLGTEKLAQLSGKRKAPFLDNVEALVAVQYAEFAGLDGVFWNDEPNPSCYSAPRAVIVRPQLASWQIEHCAENAAPSLDDE